ncbi:MAG: inositol monophosphatase family protein [Devosiaceae bacterium]
MAASIDDETSARAALFEPIKAIAREVTLPAFRADIAVENKLAGEDGFDPVTAADMGCEEAIRALIETHFPQDGIFGEEFSNVRLDAPFIWVIDPIDGTRAFVSGVPLWGTLVGLTHTGLPVAGLGYQPFIGEAFSAVQHKGAHWRKGEATKTLRTRPCHTMGGATLMTTTPALFNAQERTVYDMLEQQVRSVRYGTDWYSYALIAAGTVDIVVESGLSPYDILALIPIVEAAGGSIVDWRGKPITNITDSFSGQVIAVGDPSLLPSVTAILAPAAC